MLNIAKSKSTEQKPNKWYSFLRSFMIVGVTYALSVYSLGSQAGEAFGEVENGPAPLGLAILVGAVVCVFTFSHVFIVGSFGILIFTSLRRFRFDQLDTIGDKFKTAIFLGFLCIWFGGWFGMPTLFLGFATGSLTLVWLCAWLAFTSPGHRMLAFIEHGSTSFAMMLSMMVFLTGSWLTIGLVLAFQVFLLAGIDQFGESLNSQIEDQTESYWIPKTIKRWKKKIAEHYKRPESDQSAITTRVSDRKKSKDASVGVSEYILPTLFLVACVVFLIVHFQWSAWKRASDEVRAVHNAQRDLLLEIGGTVDRPRHSREGYKANLVDKRATDSDLEVLGQFARIGELRLSESLVTDEGLAHLANVNSVDILDLGETRITDTGLAHLAKVAIRRELNLRETKISDTGLGHLKLAEVQSVNLRGTGVTGPGLNQLRGCPKLMDLDLQYTSIFDDDIPIIRSLASHTEHGRWRGTRLILERTKISRQSRTLLQSMPEFTVWPISYRKEPEVVDGKTEFKLLNLDIDEVSSINDQHLVVGWDRPGWIQRHGMLTEAVLVLPHDSNGDGLPDTYLKDSNHDGENDLLKRLGTMPGAIGHARAVQINNRGQIVGTIGQNGFLINPIDSNGDSKPDTWFKDAGDGKTNRLMINLGKCQPTGINNRGQVVGWFSNRRLFVIDPKDVDKDGSLEWFETGSESGANLLVTDLSGSHVSAGFMPVGINDRGQILGEVMNLGNWEFRGCPFLMSPEIETASQTLTWFRDSNKDQMNDLLRPVKSSLNQPRADGLAFAKDLSRFATWHQNGKNETTIHWRITVDGTINKEKETSPVTVGTKVLTTDGTAIGRKIGSKRYHIYLAVDVNKAGLVIGKAPITAREIRGHVAVPK